MDSASAAPDSLRIAGIDLGTNTALLLVADVTAGGRVTAIYEEHAVPRLGREVDQKGQIRSSIFPEIASIIRKYREKSEELGAVAVVACGTSALRDSANKEEFIGYMRSASGVEITPISGEEEALLTFRGAASGLDEHGIPPLVLDIGGGSTEISWQEGNPPAILRESIRIGAVRLTERHYRHTPPLAAEIRNARAFIQEEFRRLPMDRIPPRQLVGVAGTATTLACLDQGLREFDGVKVAGYHLRAESVTEWSDRLNGMKPTEVLALSNAATGRADILAAGALILSEFMRTFHYARVSVSVRGLRYGIVLKERERLSKSAFRSA